MLPMPIAAIKHLSEESLECPFTVVWALSFGDMIKNGFGASILS